MIAEKRVTEFPLLTEHCKYNITGHEYAKYVKSHNLTKKIMPNSKNSLKVRSGMMYKTHLALEINIAFPLIPIPEIIMQHFLNRQQDVKMNVKCPNPGYCLGLRMHVSAKINFRRIL